MYLSNLWMNQSVQNAVKTLLKDAQDARINGIVQGSVNLGSGKDINLCVI
jgi:hypothetical protein